VLNPSGEKRGIWYWGGLLLPRGFEDGKARLRRDFSLYQKLKITNVFLLTKTDADYCFYDTHVGLRHPDFDWDILEVACEIADELNISIHPWICAMTNRHLISGNPTVAMVDIEGNPSSDWSNPMLPEVRNYILNIVNEIITNYNVKGIHLDYIRYPDSIYSYDSYSRNAFQSEYGFDPITNPSAPEWLNWRCKQITQLVNDVKVAVKNYNPDLKLSAAVIVPQSTAKATVFQDWADWSDKRLIDFLCPMAYTASTVVYENYVKNVMYYTAGKIQVLIGTGIWLYANNPNRKEIFLTQIGITRKYNADGWVLFRDEFISPFVEYFSELEPKPDVLTQYIILTLFTASLPLIIPVVSELALIVEAKVEEELRKLWYELRWE
jgi:uncharacterized lipoprotein YddW (UPF0748 family)